MLAHTAALASTDAIVSAMRTRPTEPITIDPEWQGPEYKRAQAEAKQKLRTGTWHPTAKRGDAIEFKRSGSKYQISATGAYIAAGLRLTKAEKKQAKKQRRIDREQAAANLKGN